MNAVMENLLTRRSVRSFKEDTLPVDRLMKIAEAGTYAPSGKNGQTWKFTVICRTDQIEELSRAIAAELGREGYDMYRPAALIIPSNKAESPFGKEDNACALENMFLAAHSFGIGSVWINQLQGICDRPSVRSILTAWRIPADHVVYGLAALGYPAEIGVKEIKKTGVIEVIQ